MKVPTLVHPITQRLSRILRCSICCLSLLQTNDKIHAQPIATYKSEGTRPILMTVVETYMIERTPDWSPANPIFPMPVVQTISAARKRLDELEIQPPPNSFKVSSVELFPSAIRLNGVQDKWYWVVTFSSSINSNVVANSTFPIAVLMNGKCVNPEPSSKSRLLLHPRYFDPMASSTDDKIKYGTSELVHDFVFELTTEVLRARSLWKNVDIEPPVPTLDAIRIAEDYVAELLPVATESEVVSANLTHDLKSDGWYWVVGFFVMNRESKLPQKLPWEASPFFKLPIIVLMDGKPVKCLDRTD